MAKMELKEIAKRLQIVTLSQDEIKVTFTAPSGMMLVGFFSPSHSGSDAAVIEMFTEIKKAAQSGNLEHLTYSNVANLLHYLLKFVDSKGNVYYYDVVDNKEQQL